MQVELSSAHRGEKERIQLRSRTGSAGPENRKRVPRVNLEGSGSEGGWRGHRWKKAAKKKREGTRNIPKMEGNFLSGKVSKNQKAACDRPGATAGEPSEARLSLPSGRAPIQASSGPYLQKSTRAESTTWFAGGRFITSLNRS